MNNLVVIITLYLIIKATSILEFILDSNALVYDLTIESDSFFQNISFNLPTMKLCLGTPNNQCFNVALSTSSIYTIVEDKRRSYHNFNNAFSPANSTTHESTGSSLGIRLFRPRFVLADSVKDYISFPSFPSLSMNDKHTFLLFWSRPNDFIVSFDGFIGLVKYYSKEEDNMDNPNYSFLHYLYHVTKVIDYPTFSIEYTREGIGKATFGDNYDDLVKCSGRYISELYHLWSCDVDLVIIGTKVIQIDRLPAIFDSVYSLISAPSSAGLQIFRHIIDMTGNKCIVESDKEYRYLKCDESTVVGSFPDIHLTMNQTKIDLEWKYLFKERINKKNERSLISIFVVEDQSREKNNVWVIGIPGFINHKMLFDQKSGSVGLYKTLKSNDDDDRLNNNHNHHSFKSFNYAYGFMICLLIIGIMIILFTKYYLSKKLLLL